jgi:hypothetical protein
MVILLTAGKSLAQEQPLRIEIKWDKVTAVSKTTPTLQVVVNPPLRRGSAIHDNVFKALRDLQADYVRYVPWLPYPKLGVAELEPPKDGKTSWDFSLIDPMTVDFLEAMKGRSVVLNFSTIPQWMFKTEKPVPYPADPDQAVWTYTQGDQLRDPSVKEVADYYARLIGWYTQGGFTDEAGKRHESGHRYSIPYWEVLNEPDLEHDLSPQAYTRIYDAVVEAIRKVQPRTKFVGISLAFPGRSPEFFEYFLNHKNHKPGIQLDYISYHFYAVPAPGDPYEVLPYTFFTQADGFLNVVRYIESIRKRLSPETGTMINEVGSILSSDFGQSQPGFTHPPIPNSYWNLSGAVYAYLFGELTRLGIDIVGESQLVGYPTQFPSVSMVDWDTGKPNARYWVLKLLRENFGPGDKLVEIPRGPFSPSNPYIYSQPVITKAGKRRILLVNKLDRAFDITIPGASGGQMEYVDQTTAFNQPASSKLTGDALKLKGFGVAVVTLP